MSKFLPLVLCIIVFAVGLYVGVIFSNQKTIVETPNEAQLTKQIQDIVIKQVQAAQNEKYDVEEASSSEEKKISPYAKLIVEKYYKKCGHTTVDVIDVPIELINYTEEEFRKKYDKWEVRSFEPKEISIYREIDANCSSHFVIKDDDGYLAVYSEITNDVLELKEKTEIQLADLRDEDRVAIENGIRIYGNAELSSFLEDFNS